MPGFKSVADSGSIVASSGTATATVPVPSGLAAGDLLVAGVSTALNVPVAPSGWSLVYTVNSLGTGGGILAIFSKRATSSESPYAFTVSNDQIGAIVVDMGTGIPTGATPANAGSAAGGGATSYTPSWASGAVTVGFVTVSLINGNSSIEGGSPLAAPIGSSNAAWWLAAYATQPALSTPDPLGGIWASVALEVVTAPPQTPTLIWPAKGTYLDSQNDGVTFEAQYNSGDGEPMNAYALRLKTSGAGSYLYWNASTGAFQSSIVWNSEIVTDGETWIVDVPPGAIPDGATYSWSAASQST